MDWIPLHFWSKDVNKYLSYCLDEVEETIHIVNVFANGYDESIYE